MSHGAPVNVEPILSLLPTDLEGKRILDVGLGCGEVMQIITSYSGHYWVNYSGMPHIIGLDINPGCVAYAKKWMPIYREAYEYDATHIPYPPEFIRDLEVLICTEVPEHLSDKTVGLKMVEYLSDKAKLVVFTCPLGWSEKNTAPKHEQYMNQNTAWYPQDFIDLGFKVRRLGGDRKIIRIMNFFLRRPAPTQYIFAYRVNERCPSQ